MTCNGFESRDLWSTALWINNHEPFYSEICELAELVVYNQLKHAEAADKFLRGKGFRTPDGHRWNRDQVIDMIHEQFEEMLEWS